MNEDTELTNFPRGVTLKPRMIPRQGKPGEMSALQDVAKFS